MLSTPKAAPLTALLRTRIREDPGSYPCYTAHNFVYTARAGCRARCCINPPVTPDGEDTPRWAEAEAARAEEEAARTAEEEVSIGRQPVFSPDKTVFTHSVESGDTPPGATNYEFHRAGNKHPGVPGWRPQSPVVTDTPKRDKVEDNQ